MSRLARAAYQISWLKNQRPAKPRSAAPNIERIVEQFADELNFTSPRERWEKFVITNSVHHSTSDDEEHITLRGATSSMRKRHVSIVYHLYVNKTRTDDENPVGIYDSCQAFPNEQKDGQLVRNSYESRLSRSSIFDTTKPGYTTVGWTRNIGYYVVGLDGKSQHQVNPVPYATRPGDYFFTNPVTKVSNLAYFPPSVPLPSATPEPEMNDPVKDASDSLQQLTFRQDNADEDVTEDVVDSDDVEQDWQWDGGEKADWRLIGPNTAEWYRPEQESSNDMCKGKGSGT